MSEIKYSFIMPYHKRSVQLQCTLNSFVCHYENRHDYEVIIIEDLKNAEDKGSHSRLISVMEEYYGKVPIIHIVDGSHDCYNPSVLFNSGVKCARGEYVIITNPECAHATNILVGVDEELEIDPKVYVVCACKSSKLETIPFNKLADTEGKWFQHSLHRNILCHFCSVISKEQFQMIGGFDERYKKGVCFEDDDFRNRIMLLYKIKVVTRDDLLTIHLHHKKSKPPDYLKRHKLNKDLYDGIWGENTFRAEALTLKG